MVSLINLERKQPMRIAKVEGGHNLTNRLRELGVAVGATITKVSGPHLGGAVTINVNGSRIAIGNGMASKIFLEEATS